MYLMRRRRRRRKKRRRKRRKIFHQKIEESLHPLLHDLNSVNITMMMLMKMMHKSSF
jgi:hypothetical protein